MVFKIKNYLIKWNINDFKNKIFKLIKIDKFN